MRWKEFLKPSLWKVVLTFVILAITPMMAGDVMFTALHWVIASFFAPLQLLFPPKNPISPINTIIFMLTGFGFLLVAYLISCLVLWFWKKKPKPLPKSQAK